MSDTTTPLADLLHPVPWPIRHQLGDPHIAHLLGRPEPLRHVERAADFRWRDSQSGRVGAAVEAQAYDELAKVIRGGDLDLDAFAALGILRRTFRPT